MDNKQKPVAIKIFLIISRINDRRCFLLYLSMGKFIKKEIDQTQNFNEIKQLVSLVERLIFLKSRSQTIFISPGVYLIIHDTRTRCY